MKIAIVGGGVSGLVALHRLAREHEVWLFEAAPRLGGHTRTVEVEEEGGKTLPIDMGFIVYNQRNYPHFTRLLAELGVETGISEMSFSVRSERTGLEWNGSSLNQVFAQRSNLLRPSFYGMLWEILRFHREVPRLLASDLDPTLGEFLAERGFSGPFVDHYLIPMTSAIWSTDPRHMLDYPARPLFTFLDNHGLVQLGGRPQWRYLRGGSRSYVEALAAPLTERIVLSTPIERITRTTEAVEVKPVGGAVARFDRVVLATHSDQALRLLADPTPSEREVLGAIHYQESEVVLHTDDSFLPRRALARASWNYHLGVEGEGVTMTYFMNRLQCLDSACSYCVTLNRTAEIAPEAILERAAMAHPLYTREALAAQGRWGEISGGRTLYCGAYWGDGFHEDGVVSALRVVEEIAAVPAQEATSVQTRGPRPERGSRRSALYVGQIRHRRLLPVRHEFTYPLFLAYLDLDEVPAVFAGRWLWSARGPNVVWFRRADYLGDRSEPLADAVRRLVEERTGGRPEGPIRLLTHLRTWGVKMNPASFYYCFAEDGETLEHLVVEVTNTPWGESYCYVLSPPATDPAAHHAVAGQKMFHVSPFMDLEQQYLWRFGVPGEELFVQVENRAREGKLFDATLTLERRAWTARNLAGALVRFPFLTARVAVWIYLEALGLWLKKVPFHPHPKIADPDLSAPGPEPLGGTPHVLVDR